MTYNEQKKQAMNDPACSYWLRDAIESLDKRDPVDALHDANWLAGAMERRNNEIKPNQ